MRLLLPLLLALLGLGGGIGAGLFLKPPPEPAAAEEGHDEGSAEAEDESAESPAAAPASDHGGGGDDAAEGETDFVRLNNQFVVPIVTGGRVTSLVVLAISLEVDTGMRETVYAREPKLRDRFLGVLFDHANTGGFDGVFTTSDNLNTLRAALAEAAMATLGPKMRNVLIIDLVRQDT